MALKGFSHPAAQISWLTVVLTWPSLLLFYLKLLVWPVGLSPFYGLQFVSHPTMRNTIFPALALLLVSAALWKWASHSRPIAFAIPWLIFPILPVLNVQVFGNGNFAHNRYLYLPSVGFAMLVAVALRKLKFGRHTFGAVPSSQVGVCFGLALLLGFAIQVEDRYYASDAAFYSYAYSRMGNNDPVIGMDYANTLAEQGDFDHAAAIYRELIQAHPDMWDAYFNLGYMYYQPGELDSAVQYLSRACRRRSHERRGGFLPRARRFEIEPYGRGGSESAARHRPRPYDPELSLRAGNGFESEGKLASSDGGVQPGTCTQPGAPSRRAAGRGNSKAVGGKVATVSVQGSV